MVIDRPVRSVSGTRWRRRPKRSSMPWWTMPWRRMRSPTPAWFSSSTVPCSSTPARTRCSTYSRLRASSTTDSMPSRCSRCDSSRPAGPAPTIPTWVRMWCSLGRPVVTISIEEDAMSETRTGPSVRGYRRGDAGSRPPYLYPDYQATRLRAPRRPLTLLPYSLTEVTGPLLGEGRVGELDHDLTRQHPGEPLGERIVVTGRVLDGDGRPVPHTLVEVWQANAAGRYAHDVDRHPAPLDPNFSGVGRCLTGADGGYRFVTVKPGAYPWRNHPNAWRPARIHSSLFGRAFTQRMVTHMYFPGDPLFGQDPMFNSIPDPAARQRMVAGFALDATVPEWALGYRFDVVLRGRDATPPDEEEDGG